MTTQRPNAPPEPESLEDLHLRARPAPVTRINLRVLIGGAAVLLLLISLLVLAALRPLSLRLTGSQELYNVDHKPITEALSKLPATYDGVRPDKKADAGKVPTVLAPGVPRLTEPSSDPIGEAERVEEAGDPVEDGTTCRCACRLREPPAACRKIVRRGCASRLGTLTRLLGAPARLDRQPCQSPVGGGPVRRCRSLPCEVRQRARGPAQVAAPFEPRRLLEVRPGRGGRVRLRWCRGRNRSWRRFRRPGIQGRHG